jgi:acyl-CoA thioester hydrolase
MAKLNLQLPTTLIFSTKINVRISDINYGNHVGNDSFVSILHEARVQWLKQHNCQN